MILISDSYRPIELYIILKRSEIQFIDMILLVLVELLSKNVLAIDYQTVRLKVEAGNLKVGTNYKSYEAKPIDEIFLHLFKEESHLIFNFQYVLMIAIEKASSKNRMIRLATKSVNLQKNLKNKTLMSIFGKVKLNKSGKKLSDQIGREFLILKQKLNSLIKSSASNQTEILNLMRNRYYFLENYVVQDIFGTSTQNILMKYKSEDYDIHYELSLQYFKERLQIAHIEMLEMDYRMKEHEIERYGDGLE